MRLTAESILAAQDLTIKTITVPEWGGEVSYRAITLEELRKWEDAVNAEGAKPDAMMAHLLVLSLCNERGELLFKPDDVNLLVGKNGQAVKSLYEACCELNGIGKAGRKVAQGNSESPASDSV